MYRFLICCVLGVVTALPASVFAAQTLTVYSSRKEHLVKPLFDAFTEQTGVEIEYITDKAGPLIQRLEAEGKRTPADLLITVDAGNLWQAAEKALLLPVESKVLTSRVPAHLRDPGNRWFGLSIRARTLVYSKDRVAPDASLGYQDLADPKWRGRLCLRTSKKVYNQSLVAAMIARHGEAETERVVRGWVANLAAPPFSNDTKAMQAVASGQCDVTVVNTYYYGRLQKKEPTLPLGLAWADQQGSGVHINISGAGVTRHAKHPELATQFLEWLTSAEAQGMLAGMNMEYPVNPGVPVSELVAGWGEFKADDLNVSEAGRLQATAIRLMDRAGYK